MRQKEYGAEDDGVIYSPEYVAFLEYRRRVFGELDSVEEGFEQQ